MMKFFHSWTDDARAYEWSTVRGYIKLVYLAMEQGELSWTDTSSIAEIRAKAIERGLLTQATGTRVRQTGQQKSQQASDSGSNTQKQRYCGSFNKGTCTNKSQDHQSEHICAFCLNKKKKEIGRAHV
jgi:hypothetical protein